MMLPIFLSLVLGQIPELSTPPQQILEMKKIEIQIGTGAEAQPGQKYKVHYTGWLSDGTKFDSSVDRNQPFEFIQGRRRVIAGWEAGFEGMKVGGKRRLIIPYQMAYGEQGRGNIPPKAELIFDVELLEVQEEPPAVAARDLMPAFEDYARKIDQMLLAIPAEKWEWRPAPGLRSVREVFLHLSLYNQFYLWLGEEQPSTSAIEQRRKEMAAAELEGLSRERTREQLEASFAAVRKSLPPLRAAQLDNERDVLGQTSTLRGVYILLETHLAEHLGQLVLYGRLSGIAPPWTR